MDIAKVIKYEGDNTTFVWKHPQEDFNTSSQLIVHESQEALFMMNGQALDLFGPGRYTLETQNIPMIGKFINAVTGGKTMFHCEVYFINKTVQMALPWGTSSKVRYIDPDTGVPIELGACGNMNLEVSDSRKLLTKLVGTMKGVSWDKKGNSDEPTFSKTAESYSTNYFNTKEGFTKSLKYCFDPLIQTSLKSYLPAAIKDEKMDILEVDEHLDKLSENMRIKINPGFEEYGLHIPQFYITTIVFPEEDPNFKRIRELHAISLQTRMINANAAIRSAQALADANVLAAQRQVEMEKETTQTEKEKREAERKIIQAQTEAQRIVLDSQAQATKRAQEGYTYQQERGFDVAQDIANNETVGQFTNLGVGLGTAAGVGVALGGTVSSAIKNVVNSTDPFNTQAKCPKCGSPLPPNAKFCVECGERIQPLDSNTIVCPNCGKTIVKGKFCPECGYQFIQKCPKCGSEVPVGSKFCVECGEKLS